MLVTLKEVSFGYDDNLIFQDVNLVVNEGERVGLIGANGEGKTTLINLILGKLDAVGGEVILKNGVKIGYLEQNGGYESGASVYQEMRSVFKEQLEKIEQLSVLSQKIALCEYDGTEYKTLSSKIDALEKYLSANDCYNIDVKIKTVLNGMGFENCYDQIIDSMSGGEKTRLKLARLLLEEPELLVLDEPTNHLDIKTLFWLEEYLQTFKGAILIVSHDRYFLDRIIKKTFEIENKKVLFFNGNYSKYKVLKEQRNALLLKEYEKYLEEKAKLQDYVARNIVRATTAKSAQSRVKQLEKLEEKQKPYVSPAPPRFTFNYQAEPYERVLTISNLNLEIGEKTLITGGNLQVLRGQKIAIVGENGSGKSTLLKEIIARKNGAIEVGRLVHFAHYDQENANLDGENTVLEEMWGRHVIASQTEIRSALARCGLFPEDMDKKVKSLSGGERAKLALCVFESEKGNVLILDEPTNHLDLPARESLERALRDFTGTLIFVSHDRYFISAIADRVVEIEGGKLISYEGDYEFYQASKAIEKSQALEEERKREQERYRQEKQTAFRSRQDRAQEVNRKNRIKAIETDIYALECEENDINNMLADGQIASDYQRLSPLLKRLEEIKIEQEKLYLEYEKLI